MKQIEDFTISKFFFDISLYTKIRIINGDTTILSKIIGYHIFTEDFDGYNCLRKIDTTFTIFTRNSNTELLDFLNKGGYLTIYIQCKRYNDIFTFSIFYDAEKSFFLKIGQYPSIADFHIYI